MSLLKRVFDFYLDASIHVAFSVYCLLQITFEIVNNTYHYHLSFFMFFGSISCYNFIKYGVEAKKYILVANQYHKGIQFFSFISLGFAMYHAYFVNLNTWFGVGCLLLLTALYALPVLPKAKNLRSWGGLKIFVVALVWAGATVLLPVLSTNQIITWDVHVELVQRFLLILILLIPFEIRDLAYDNVGLRTMPQRYGVRNSKIFGVCVSLFFFFSTFMKDDLSSEELILKALLFVILLVMLGVTKKIQSKYFASFWVEALPILWYGSMLLVVRWF